MKYKYVERECYKDSRSFNWYMIIAFQEYAVKSLKNGGGV